MKKLVNVVTLVVMVSVNTMTPFTYAFAQYDEPVYSQEVVEVSDDTANSSAGDSSSETGYEENIQGESPVDFSLNTESQTSAEDSQQAEQALASSQNDGEVQDFHPAQLDKLRSEGQVGGEEDSSTLAQDGETPMDSSHSFEMTDEQEEEEELDFTGKTVAAVTKMLGGNWETDSDGYAEALGIENYQGYPEQNEIIRNYMVTNKALPEKGQNTQDFHPAQLDKLRSEGQAGSEGDTQISDDEDGEDDEDPLPEEGDTQDSSLDAQNDSEQPEGEDEMGFFDELGEGIQNLFDKIRYFFTDEENESYIIYSEDDNNIGIITLKDPETAATITIMDRNLGAEKVNDYGYYFQWGNNHGVEEVNSTNKTTIKAIYDDSYYAKGYDGNGLFIVGDSDYREDGNHYNNLWGGDLKEQYKQASCPAGYHVPTAKEWNQLMSIWGKIHTQDVSVDEEGQNVSQTRYTANSSETKIASFKDQAQQCEESDTQCVDEDSFSDIINILSSELRLPLAGGYDEDGKYYDEGGIYWTSTARDGEKALIFDIDAYFGINGDDNLGYKAQGHNIRCFQNVTERDAGEDIQDSQQTEQAQQAEGTSADASEGQDDTNNNPGSASMTDQDGNGTQNENEVEPRLNVNVENSSEGQAGDDEQAKTDSDISVLDYLFHEGVGDSASSPFPGDEEDNLEQSFTGDVENLSGAALELATAWEKLNVEPITKADRYNKVSVNVEAPAGTFPEGTYANIRPIVSTVKLDEIKGQISEEDKTVSQESEVVAFDITFMYKLSDGTEVEVQPKENTVKVAFNYEDNDELSKADEIDQQEVKVFHIEEVKDEQGNKTGEEKVNDVTNKEESVENGIAVADAESFSIYAVITTTAGTDINITYDLNGGYWQEDQSQSSKTSTYTEINGEYKTSTHYKTPYKDGYMFMGWFDQTGTERRNGTTNVDKTVYAKWKNFRDLDVYVILSESNSGHYTLMDRNMGAIDIYDISETTVNPESMGYYYQWGNNYGFDSYYDNHNAVSGLTQQTVDVSDYSWESPYYSNKYVWGGGTPSHWMSSIRKELWGDVENTTLADRQGPCPDGYHVPTKDEWTSMLSEWKAVNTRDNKNFYYDFLMPPAGRRDRGFNSGKQGLVVEMEKFRYITSSWNGTEMQKKSVYAIASDSMNNIPTVSTNPDKSPTHERSTNGLSLRCFKNANNEGDTAVLTDITLNGGQKAIISVVDGKISLLQEPTKTNFVFGGWYTTSDYQIGTKVVTGSSISSETSLYARWKCPDGKAYNANNICVDGKTITFKSEDGTQELGKTTVLEGENAYYDDVNPTKDPLIDTEYTFAGWTTQPNGGGNVDDLSNVLTNRTVYAHFTESTRKYTITWLDDEGELIDTTSVEYNTIPTHADVIKEPTVTIEYSFNGWTPTPTLVAGDATYTATFLESPRKYEITWVDGNGDTLKTEQVGYGSTPAYIGNTPTKAADTQYSYEFNNTWSPAVVPVAGDATYTAQFDPTLREYAITWVDGNGHTIYSENVAYGDTPSYNTTTYGTPTKAATAQYTYEFNNTWSPNIVSVVGDATYTAQFDYSTRTYTVTWNNRDGTNLEIDENVPYAAYPRYDGSIPYKQGDATHSYRFDGWTKLVEGNPVSVDPTTDPVLGDVTYTADFEEYNGYIVYFDVNGGEPVESMEHEGQGARDIELPSATREGYTFDGWKLGGEGETLPAGSSYTVTQNVTFEAQWTPITYTISYYDTDGTTPLVIQGAPSSYTIEQPFTIPNPTKVGYTFAGWREYIHNGVNWIEERPGIVYYNADGLRFLQGNKGNRKYEAQWSEVKKTIIWVDDDLSLLTVSNVQLGTQVSTISNIPNFVPNVTKKITPQYTYTFIGWTKGDDPTILDLSTEYVVGDAVYKASYTRTVNQYKVTFVNEDGTSVIKVDPDDEHDYREYDYGSTSILVPTPPDKTGYQFDGWLKKVGQDPYSTDVVDMSTEVVTADVTYKAKYSEIEDEYTITFVLGNGDSDVVVTGREGEPVTSPTGFVRNGYTFAGWDKAVPATMPAHDDTITAQWTANSYSVHFDKNDEGATGTMSDQSFTYDEASKPLTTNGFSKAGYTFAGWATSSDGDVEYIDGQSVQNLTSAVDGVVNLYAKWTADQHSITYNNTKGATNTNPVEFNTDTPTINLTDLSVAGYTFDGWYDAAQGGNKITQIVQGTTNDVVLYAHWTAIPYSIIYTQVPEGYVATTYSYTIEDSFTIPNPASVVGQTFKGWKEYVNMAEDGQTPDWQEPNPGQIYYNANGITIQSGNIGDRKYEAQWEVKTYTVFWVDEDLEILETDNDVNHGSHPQFDETTPTKTDTAEWDYEFETWTKNGVDVDITTETVTSNVIYKAKYSETKKEYTITFVNDDNSQLSTHDYEYGTAVSDINQPANPTKDDSADGHYRYEFIGWTPELAEVTGIQTYTATYDEIPNTFTVIWKSNSETTIETDSNVVWGTAPEYNGITPTKEVDDGYQYSFTTWNDGTFSYTMSQLENYEVKSNVVFTAEYTPSPFHYSVELNANGGEVSPSFVSVEYGSDYGHSDPALPTPTKAGWDFLGWYTDPTNGTKIESNTSVTLAAKNQILYAHWTPSDYDLEFVDDDDSPLEDPTTYTINNTIPLSVPTKGGYTFIGWKEYVDGVYTRAYLANDLPLTLPAGNIGDRKYVAQWNLNGHVVIWLDDDQRVLDIDTNIPDETLVTEIEPAEPTKAQDNQYTYTFDKWLKEVIGGNPAVVSDWDHERVTADVKYQASYQSHIRQYSVTFVGEDGETVLQPAALYDYGTTAANITKPAEPTKAATAAHTYTFVGWKANGQGEPIPTVSLPNVTGNVTYWASFTETTNQYEVTFVDENGTTVLKAATQYDYNTPAALIEQPATPTKAETLSHTYTFAGWNPALADVTADATYTATYTSTPKQYTITLNPDGGVIEGAATTKEVTFGSTYGELPTPTKLGYTFGGWFDADDTQQQNEITSATVVTTDAINQTLKAKWTVQKFNIRYLEDDRQTPVTVSDPMTKYTVDNPIVIKNPTKEGHTFIGWKECVENDCSTAYLKDGSSSIRIPAGKTGDRDYLAIWNVHGHVVIWEDYNGVVLEIDPNVDYGDSVSYDVEDEDHNPKYPSREDTAEWNYEFTGWTDGEHTYGINDPLPKMGDADITYTATYSEIKNKYTITFVDTEKAEPVSHDYEYGTTVENIDIPELSKNSDDECEEYVGAWDHEVQTVTGRDTYTSVYTCTEKKKYLVTWLNYNDVSLWEEEVYYGEVPFYDEEVHGTPERSPSGGKVYKFIGWTPARTAVTGPQTYVATYSDDPNTFIVTFDPKGGTVIPYRKPVTFGSTYGDLPTPVKAGYTFDGWYSDDVTFAHEVVSTDTYTLTTNQTIYAKWNINNYDISYQNVENTYAGPATYTVEDENVTIPNPTKDGYTFVAWKEYVCNIAQCSSSSDWTFVKDILKNVDGYTIPQGATGDREFRAQWDINRYKVVFKNYDDTILDVQMLDYGTPVTAPANPSKPNSSNGQFRYEFAGWKANGEGDLIPKTSTLPVATEDVDYIAQFNEITRKYTVTFQNYDETELQSSDVNYGTAPVYAGETPTKASTSQYSYTFNGWTDGTSEYAKDATLPDVSGETTYTAVFTQSPVKYTVTFKDWNDEIISAKEYGYGTHVADIVKPADPTRDGYTFAGWSEIPETMPAEDVTVTATYTINSYTVTFDSDGGSAVDAETLKYNTAVSRPTDPTKEGYTFSKWQKVDGQTLSDYDFATPVTADITLKAIWTKNTYTVVYKDGNNDITIPDATTSYTITDQITIPNPEKDGYTFIAWEEYVCTKTIKSECTSSDRKHTRDILKSGESITIPVGNIGHREYRAQWNINNYEVIFQNYDRSILKAQKLDYGTPVTAPSDPTKPADAEKVYIFDGWQVNGEGDIIPTADLPTVSGDVHYVAHFVESANQHTITFKNEDGTELQSSNVKYGETPSYSGQTPTKAADDQYTYIFAGWTSGTTEYGKDETLPAVTGEAIYTAIYTSTVNEYTITWKSDADTTIDTTTVAYGQMPTHAIPTKDGYTFAGWNPDVVKVERNATYTATWREYELHSFYTKGGDQFAVALYKDDKSFDISATEQINGGINDRALAQFLLGADAVADLTDEEVSELLNNTQFEIKDISDLGGEVLFLGFTNSEDKPQTKGFCSDAGCDYFSSSDSDSKVDDAVRTKGMNLTKVQKPSWVDEPVINNNKYKEVRDSSDNLKGFVVLVNDGYLYVPVMKYTVTWKNANTTLETDQNVPYSATPKYDGESPIKAADDQYTYTFKGWSDGTASYTKDATLPGISGNVTYTAEFDNTTNKYTVKFVQEDGITSIKVDDKDSKDYDYGTSADDIIVPEAPAKTGWRFTGWTPEIEDVTADVTYRATYAINQYTITFDSNGGSAVPAITQNYGTEVEAPAHPTREGYTFAGWDVEVPATMPAEDKTITAQWTANEYTVTFNPGNGATVDPASKTVTFDSTYGDLPTPVKNGYTFNGWYDDETEGNKVKADIVVSTAANHTLYAQWTANEYSVTFNPGEGATVNPTSKTVTFDSDYGTLPTPVKNGYTFNGWYTAATEGTKVESDTTVTTASAHILYAQWTINTYTITYDYAGGTLSDGVTNPNAYNVEESVKIYAPKKTGYTFKGWKEYVKSGENSRTFVQDIFESGNSITVAAGATGHKKYEAQWTRNSYTVSFYPNGGSNIDSQSVLYNNKIEDTTALQNFANSKEGYTFKGWYTTSNFAEGTEFDFDTPVTDRLNLYAKWDKDRYTITYQLNGGELTNQLAQYSIDFVSWTILKPTKEGYTFKGWSDVESDIEGMPQTISLTNQWFRDHGFKNRTFVANWEINHYTVKYMDGVDELVDLRDTVDHGDTISPLPVPTKEGYTFVKWYKEPKLINEWTATDTVTSDTTLYAKWRKYTVYGPFYMTDGTKFNIALFDDDGSIDIEGTKANNDPSVITPEREQGLRYSQAEVVELPELGDVLFIKSPRPADPTKSDTKGFCSTQACNYFASEGAESVTSEFKSQAMDTTNPEGPSWTDGATNYMKYHEVRDDNDKLKGFTVLVSKGNVNGYIYVPVKQYEVTFVDENGTPVLKPATQYGYGTPAVDIVKPADPTKAADDQYTYTFAGWDPEVVEVTDDAIYTATYSSTVNQYEVTFVDEDGTELKEPTAYDYGTAAADITKPADPIKEGYTFDGWDPEVVEVTDDAIYTATYTANSYSVHFDKNDVKATGTMSDQSFTYDEASKALTANTFSKEGYTFAGWATSSDGEVVYTDGQSVQNLTSAEDGVVNLYAKWTANTDTPYIVKHCKQDLEDETKFEDCESEDKEGTTDTDTAATAKTYEGFTAPSVITQENIEGDESTIVEIRYTRNSYTLSYEYTNTPESPMPALPAVETYKFGASITLADAPSMYGYTFGGWQNFPEGNTMPANDVTVKGTWTPVKYTVSVSTKTNSENSALGGVVYGAGDYDYKSEVTLFAIPNEGYDFIGWTWEGQDELVKPQVKIIQSLLANQTLTAHFQTSEHTVEFDSDGGTAKPTQTIKHGLKVIEPEDPTKEGYTFAGWYNGSDEYDFDAPVTSNLQLKAHWTINQYTITFDTDGGTTIAPITQDYNTAVTAPADPTKDGYTFDGWDKDIPATMPAEDMTITAQWSIAHYGVNLVDDDHSTLSLISHESGEDIQYGETVKVSVLFDDRYQLDSISSNEVTLTKESDFVYSFVMPAGGVVVTLKSKPVEYRIKYNWIGGVLDEGEENPDTYNIENYDNLVLYNPSKQGSIFKGWQLFGGEFFDGEGSHTTQVEIDSDEIGEPQTFSAVWDEEVYPITYHLGDEILGIYWVKYDSYANYISQTREGYAFDAWYTDSDFELEHKYNFGKVTGPLHLYARWIASEQTYHVYHKYLKADGSTERTQHVQYAVHTDDYIPEVPRNEDAVNDGYLLPEVQHIRIKAGSDNEVIYIYERAPFTITYKDGNKQIDKKTILYGADIPTMVAPVKEGYTFDDWYSDSELTQPYEIPETMPADNIVVYAKYDINKHTVRYMDGNRVLQKFDNVEYGSDFPTLSENPSKDGYDFVGWETIPATMPDRDVDIQSIWDAQIFTVTFKHEDGTTLQSSSVAYGQNPSYNGETPTKPATLEHMYTFVGWNDETTTYAPEQTLPAVSGDTVYTAVFDEDTSKYTVTFVDEDGETVLKATTRYDYQTSVADIIKPTNPTKAATAEYTYTFGGWDPALAPVTQNVTYMATYTQTPNTYTITFNTDGGTPRSSITAAYGTDITEQLPADPEKQGHHFDGWDKVIPTTMPSHDMTITAQWTKYYYNLTFNAASHSKVTKKTTSQDGTYAYNDEVEVSVSVDDGYRLSNITAVATTAQGDQEVRLYDQGNGVYSFFMPANPVVISTEVEAIDYGIEYDLAGGSVDDEYPDSYDMDHLTLTLKNPIREGYTFKGWKDEKGRNINAGNTTTTININSSDKSSKLYTAQWDVIEYNVKYYVDGIIKGNEKVSHNEQADITTYRPEVQEGYYFDGWYLDSQKENRYTLDGVVADIELYGFVIASDQGYLVKHRYEKLDGGYDEMQIPVTDGVVTDQIVSPEFEPKDGFKNPSARKVIQIRPGGLLTNEVIYEYTRESYQVTYKNDGEDDQYRMVKFEDYIPVLTVSSKTGQTFKGWYKVENDEVTDEKLTNLTTMSTSPVVYKAVWYDEEYTITFNVDGGSVINPITGKYGDPISVDAPTKPGYTFAGWNPALPDKMPAENMTATAQWTINQHKVTLTDSDHVTLNYLTVPDAGNKYDYASTVSLIAHVDDGYDYTVDSEEVDLIYKGDGVYQFKMPDTPVTIRATATAKTYDIDYILDGGSLPQGVSNPVHYGPTALTLTLNNPARDGYTFKGWKDETGRLFYDEDSDTTQVTINNSPLVDKTYTAQWEVNTYLVKFEMDGHTVNQQVITYRGHANYVNQSKDGYEFPGWYTDPDFAQGTEYNFNTPITSDLVLYGKFVASENEYIVIHKYLNVDGITYKPYVVHHTDVKTDDFIAEVPFAPRDGFVNPSPKSIKVMANAENIVEYVYQRGYFDIVYDVNGGTPEVATQTIMFGTKIPVPEAPTKEGYTFRGWQKQGTTEILNDNTILNDAQTVTYVAQWGENEYTITFDTDGGSAIDPITQDYGTAITVPADPTKDGYTFAGWVPAIPATMPLGGLTVKAQWTANKYTITFDTDGGSAIDPITQDYDTDIVAPANPTKEGYTFAGWDPALPAKMPLNGLTVKAQWSLGGFTITFDTDGGSAINPITQDYDTDVVAPADPTKEGYTFAGWDPALPAKMPAENMTATAQWTVNQYTITFDTNGGSVIPPITQDYGTPLIVPNPTKSGYTFKGWDPALPATVPAGDIVVVAQWEKSGGSSSGGGGGGGGSSRRSETPQEKDDKKSEENMHGSADDEVIQNEEVDNGDVAEELVIEPEALSAYEWARKYDITTMSPVENADPDGYVIRGHLAKMVVNYMVNVLGREVPYDVPYECVAWNDDPSIWESDEIRDYATKSCALGVMGIQMWNNEFKPNDIVTRAEFGTVVSRILWGDKYNSSNTKSRYRYTLHLRALKKEGIMTQITRPMKWLEIRKWVWVVMMRTQEFLNK